MVYPSAVQRGEHAAYAEQCFSFDVGSISIGVEWSTAPTGQIEIFPQLLDFG
jgi:hypothetical protein